MYTKITEQTLSLLQLGVMVVKYPLFGDPTDAVDDTKEDQISDFIVEKINLEEDTIDLQPPQHGGEIALMAVIIHPLHKTFTELVAEKVWWVKN